MVVDAHTHTHGEKDRTCQGSTGKTFVFIVRRRAAQAGHGDWTRSSLLIAHMHRCCAVISREQVPGMLHSRTRCYEKKKVRRPGLQSSWMGSGPIRRARGQHAGCRWSSLALASDGGRCHVPHWGLARPLAAAPRHALRRSTRVLFPPSSARCFWKRACECRRRPLTARRIVLQPDHVGWRWASWTIACS